MAIAVGNAIKMDISLDGNTWHCLDGLVNNVILTSSYDNIIEVDLTVALDSSMYYILGEPEKRKSSEAVERRNKEIKCSYCHTWNKPTASVCGEGESYGCGAALQKQGV